MRVVLDGATLMGIAAIISSISNLLSVMLRIKLSRPIDTQVKEVTHNCGACK